MMNRSLPFAVACAFLLVGCSEDPRPAAAWTPEGDTEGGTGGVDPDKDDTGSDTSDDDSDGDDDPDDTGPDGDPGPDTLDCSPAWSTPWIGSPCSVSSDCAFEGGTCLRETEGFPCGTCTTSCTTTCPDVDGAPETYCINGTDVGLGDAGFCLSKCDAGLLGGDGCRDGYACDTLQRHDGSGQDGICIPDEFGDGGMDDDPLVDEIDHEFLIDHLGGTPVDPFDYGPDLDSFQLYLDAVGVQHTTAEEIATPHNMAAATGCGLTLLLPERDQWEKIGALALFTDVLTELVGEPIYMRNWWRPPCYNAAVGGAAGGDHPDADAVDLDFASEESRAEGQKFLCDMYWNQDIVEPEDIAPGASVDPRLNMSIGLGGVTIHLGVLSANGRRDWKYGSYTALPNSGNCW